MPQFTLKTLLIAIALPALFLAWLRLDRATISDSTRLHPTEEHLIHRISAAPLPDYGHHSSTI